MRRFLCSLFTINLATSALANIPPCSSQQRAMHRQVVQTFNHRSVPHLVSSSRENEVDHGEVTEGELAFGPQHQWRINFRYYKSSHYRMGHQSPLLFLYSGIGGVTFVDRHFAHYFAKMGYSVVLSHYFQPEETTTIQSLNATLTRGLYANIALVDYFSHLPENDRQRLGSLGISLGGIRAVHHAVIDRRIKASVIIVAGSPLADIIAFSQEPIVSKMRQQQMLNAGITSLADYRTAIDQNLSFHVEDWTCRRNTEDFLMVISQKDVFVPTSTQWHLYQHLGGPEKFTSSLGHRSLAFKSSFGYKDEIERFFAKRL